MKTGVEEATVGIGVEEIGVEEVTSRIGETGIDAGRIGERKEGEEKGED